MKTCFKHQSHLFFLKTFISISIVFEFCGFIWIPAFAGVLSSGRKQNKWTSKFKPEEYKISGKTKSIARFILYVGLIGFGFLSSGSEKTIFDSETGFFSTKKRTLPHESNTPLSLLPLLEEGLEEGFSKGTANSNAVPFSNELNLKAAVSDGSSDGKRMSASVFGLFSFGEKAQPKEVLNIIHDTAADIQLHSKAGDLLLLAMKSLKEELEEEILTDNLTLPQVIDRLRDRISEETANLFRREVEIKMMGRLLKIGIPSPLEALETVDLLIPEFVRGKPHSYVRTAAMRVAQELFEGYIFPNQEKLNPDQLREVFSQALSKLEQNLFRIHISVREAAKRMMISLFSRGVISPSLKRKVFFRVASQVNGVNWERKVTALDFLYGTLSQGVPLDPVDVEWLTHQSMQWLIDENWGVRKGGARFLHELLRQNLLPDSEKRKKIALAMVKRMKDERGSVRKEAFRTLKTFLSQESSPDSDKLEVWQEITLLIFDERGYTGTLAAKLIRKLLESDIPFSKKITIRNKIVDELPYASNGRRKAIKVLSFSIRQGLPMGFDLFDGVVDLVSEPAPLGTEAESFIKRFLGDSGLSEGERISIDFEKERQISNRKALEELGSEVEELVRGILKDDSLFTGGRIEISDEEWDVRVEELETFEDSSSQIGLGRASACRQAMRVEIVVE